MNKATIIFMLHCSDPEHPSCSDPYLIVLVCLSVTQVVFLIQHKLCSAGVDGCEDEKLGTSGDPTTKHDTAVRYLMVDQRYSFPDDGYVDTVWLTARGTSENRTWEDNARGLKVCQISLGTHFRGEMVVLCGSLG